MNIQEKVKDSISAYFGMYKIEAAPSTPEGQTVVTLLQSLLATTKLTKVAIPSLGDLLQTITNSGYSASFKSAVSQWKKKGLSKEGLALEGGTKQIKGKDATRLDKFLGNNRYDNIIDREMSDIFMYGQGTSYKTQRYAIAIIFIGLIISSASYLLSSYNTTTQKLSLPGIELELGESEEDHKENGYSKHDEEDDD